MKNKNPKVNKRGFILLDEETDMCFGGYGYGARLSLKNASPDKVYMKRLAACRDYATAKEIYPGIKNPLKDDLKSLYDLGYVARYTKPQYLMRKEWYGDELVFPTRIWWKATEKGRKLLNKFGM